MNENILLYFTSKEGQKEAIQNLILNITSKRLGTRGWTSNEV